MVSLPTRRVKEYLMNFEEARTPHLGPPIQGPVDSETHVIWYALDQVRDAHMALLAGGNGDAAEILRGLSVVLLRHMYAIGRRSNG